MIFKRFQELIFMLLIILGVCFPSYVFGEYVAVKVPIANIRSGPGTSKDILWKVEAYHPLYTIEKKGDWIHFKDFEGDEGWIHASLVEKMDSVITKKDDCNVRSGPGTNHEIVFTAEKGIPFKVLKKENKWLYVEHADGDRGWIYSALVWPNK